MKILENIALAPSTTLGIGGPARWLVDATSEAEIAEACLWARKREVPLFVLGGGSNVLVADTGFDGLALHIAFTGMELEGELLRAAAGTPWEHCVQQATEVELAGIECLAGIPGTVGGTPVQNVGAYGQEVASVIERVRAFDLAAQKFVEFANADCGFSYRRSRFNTTDRGRYVVTRVDYRLRKNGAPTLNYAELKAHFSGRENLPSLAEVAEAVRGIRQSKGMLLVEGDPDCRSAGSFFKNPSVAPVVAERVKQIAADSGVAVRMFPAEGGLVKISAAWLIEQAGFRKGYAMGAAGISSRHTLALINRGGATAAEILALAQRIQTAVEARFGIQLQMEPEIVGF
ncbi:MAG: UDP-N-acetylmuramate dehydrogenase [Terracidiphilus sp.]|nr:UDP-N-acetylmuramate dehydrogenase [Terracidiphilus sp.]